MPDKLTDKEIVKALEHCSKQGITSECKRCKVQKGCRPYLIIEALDLINRLQAENERLQSILLAFTSEVENWSNKKGYDTTELSLIAILDEATNIKAEIKAEAYKDLIDNHSYPHPESLTERIVYVSDIIELVGEDNESKT